MSKKSRYTSKAEICFISLSILVVMGMGSVRAQDTEQDSPSKLGKEMASDIIDEGVFENAQRLAGTACDLYNLGIDFVDNTWSFLQSTAELMALFQSQSWRKLIFAVNDQYDQYLKQLGIAQKRECTLMIASGFAAPDSEQKTILDKELLRLEKIVAELKAKKDFFSNKRWEILFKPPQIIKPQDAKEKPLKAPEKLDTDLIFYSLWKNPSSLIRISAESVAFMMKDFVVRTIADLEAVWNQIPELCYASVNVLDELRMLFWYAIEPDPKSGVFKDKDGNKILNFKDFVEKNQSKIVIAYSKRCRENKPVSVKSEPTSSEKQYEIFLDALDQHLTQLEQRLLTVNIGLAALESKWRTQKGTLSPEEDKKRKEFQKERGELLSRIEYFTLMMKYVEPPSGSLKQLQESLSSLFEAILNVERDEQDKVKSKLSFAQRFQNAKEKSLQNICGRIEKMYRESDRDTTDLPVIGSANGFTYCRSKPECQGVNLANNLGTSEGRAKLAECSGFLFGEGELGPSQSTQDVIRQSSEDMAVLLEQQAYNELLKSRNLHFTSLRNRYKALYGNQTGSVAALASTLRSVEQSLYNGKEAPYDPDRTSIKTQYGLMRHIYERLWKFMDQQDGICLAPEKP